jgi:hypothetical protein
VHQNGSCSEKALRQALFELLCPLLLCHYFRTLRGYFHSFVFYELRKKKEKENRLAHYGEARFRISVSGVSFILFNKPDT